MRGAAESTSKALNDGDTGGACAQRLETGLHEPSNLVSSFCAYAPRCLRGSIAVGLARQVPYRTDDCIDFSAASAL
jgi:hypothetical protein